MEGILPSDRVMLIGQVRDAGLNKLLSLRIRGKQVEAEFSEHASVTFNQERNAFTHHFTQFIRHIGMPGESTFPIIESRTPMGTYGMAERFGLNVDILEGELQTAYRQGLDDFFGLLQLPESAPRFTPGEEFLIPWKKTVVENFPNVLHDFTTETSSYVQRTKIPGVTVVSVFDAEHDFAQRSLHFDNPPSLK